ncbi:hypothetical protein EBT25_10540 [bacterium]|nr:hypothetical protein [bacterium]
MNPIDYSRSYALTRCPSCDQKAVKVIESRETRGDSIRRRRRECGECGYRDTTYEVTEAFFNLAKENKNALIRVRKVVLGSDGTAPKEIVNTSDTTCEQCCYMGSYGCAFDFPEAGGSFAEECSMFSLVSDASAF